MAPIPGLRGSGDFTKDFRPTNYRELFTFLEPNGDAPLNALLAMLDSESTDDPKYNNFRDEMPTRTMAHSGADGGTTVTVGTAADAGWVNEGTLLVNATTGELMRATADGDTSAGTIAVTRNIGGTSHANSNGDVLFVAGWAGDEGDVSPSSITFDPVVDFNYTQIFKRPFKVTGTLKSTYLRTGDKEDEYKVKALKMHMSDIERAMFFSVRSETTGANGQKLRTTGGLLNTLSNVVDAASGFNATNTITEDEFDRLLIESVFDYGSKTKVAFCGAKVAGHMQKIGKDRWQPTSINEGTYGIQFTKYHTFAGDIMVYLHPQFRQLSHMEDAMVILDTDFMKYRYLDGRDTDLQESIQANDEDAVKHQYMTDCGLELLQDKVHTYITNWAKVA